VTVAVFRREASAGRPRRKRDTTIRTKIAPAFFIPFVSNLPEQDHDEWRLPEASTEFGAAMEDVLDLYAEPDDPKRPTANFDETSKQLSINFTLTAY